jgi:hypothetical protein
VTPTPALAGQATLVNATDAAAALARLYAGGPCLALVGDHAAVSGAELWRLEDGEPWGIVSREPHLDPAAMQAAETRSAGLHRMPAAQLDALARWGVAPQAPGEVNEQLGLQDRAGVLAHTQDDIARRLASLVTDAVLPAAPLVRVGRIFRNSRICTAIAAQLERPVVVAPDPVPAGLAVGTLAAAGAVADATPSPFAGPAFDAHATKLILDNCMLSYQFPHNPQALAVAALRQERLVAWFEGGMEWDHARSAIVRSWRIRPTRMSWRT